MSEITVRVGQQDAILVTSTAADASGPLAQIATDIDITSRANRTFLMYDAATQSYIHIDAAQIVDLADNIDDESYDAGTF
jgi:hypothetical protein